MKAKEELNKLYAQKCQILGDLMLTREKIDRQIADLKANIERLNEMVPLMDSLESVIRADERQRDADPEKSDV